MVNVCVVLFFFFKQKTAYEMRISDWSSDVCSSDLMTGECGYDGWRNGTAFCACGGRFDSVQDFERHIGTPTPVPSEVAETTAGEREVCPAKWCSSEERRVGKECVRMCRSRESPYH